MIIMPDKFPLFWFGADAVTMFKNVFIKKSTWEKMDEAQKEAMMIHENIHLKQQKKYGMKWYVKYATSKKFRFEQELEAYGIEGKHYVANGADADFIAKMLARNLSSGTYANMVEYDVAYDKLLQFINK